MTDLIDSNALRAAFSRRLSAMYAREVPAYSTLVSLVESANQAFLQRRHDSRSDNPEAVSAISEQRHGAIRVGTATELQLLRRLFALLGMAPVDFYDLVPAGLPVFSTAFRPTTVDAIDAAPFRVFCSLLRTELIEDAAVRARVESSLAGREIVSADLLSQIEAAEASGGVAIDQVDAFLSEVMQVFRWSGEAIVSSSDYEVLLGSHRLIVDIAAFPGPHINHLTPSALDIDDVHAQLAGVGLEGKAVIEGPPQRECPILLRQTAFNAVSEAVQFVDGTSGQHTARFGEVEQRGVALTPAGRARYDACLAAARQCASELGIGYEAALAEAFAEFPDDWQTLLEEDLVYGRFTLAAGADIESLGGMDISRHDDRARAVAEGVLQMESIRYEDFLPVSAAGIFRSNLRDDQGDEWSGASSQAEFEAALGCPVLDPQTLYAAEQQASIRRILATG